MNILEELNTLLTAIPIPVETGVFSGLAPDEYVVILPLSDVFEVHADNRPGFDVQEARISLFSKSNYLEWKRQITAVLLNDDFTVTERRYIGHEDDTGYHHYAIDVAKNYGMEE
jgi:hypothetical protein